MKIKAFWSILLTLVLTFSLAAAEGEDQLARIQAQGEIVIATEGAWAPWTYHDENDVLVGFDVEVAQAIGKAGYEATAMTG